MRSLAIVRLAVSGVLFAVLLLPSLARAQSRMPRSPCNDPSARCFTDKQGNKFCGYQGQTSVLCSQAPPFRPPSDPRPQSQQQRGGNACNDPAANCFNDSQGNRFCGYRGQTAVLCSKSPLPHTKPATGYSYPAEFYQGERRRYEEALSMRSLGSTLRSQAAFLVNLSKAQGGGAAWEESDRLWQRGRAHVQQAINFVNQAERADREGMTQDAVRLINQGAASESRKAKENLLASTRLLSNTIKAQARQWKLVQKGAFKGIEVIGGPPGKIFTTSLEFTQDAIEFGPEKAAENLILNLMRDLVMPF